MSVQPAANEAINPFLLDDLFDRAPVRWVRGVLQPRLESLLGLREMAQRYERLPASNTPQDFVRHCFEALNIDYAIDSGELTNIPRTGSTMVVANHPFGAVEGMLLVRLLSQYRDDVRVMANGLLKRVPELASVFIGVNPYGGQAATRANVSALREATHWLKKGGLLVVFPAGDVASLSWNKLSLEDGCWDATIARLARLSDASVVPVHFRGRNSALFCAAGLVHPVIKTMLLPRELLNKRNTTLHLHIGKPLNRKRLLSFEDMQQLADYLRMRTCLPGHEKTTSAGVKPVDDNPGHEPIVEPVAVELLTRELQALPREQCLTEAGEMEVWYARAGQIPNLLLEIGRQREISFRAVGEGTGKPTDLDLYDRFYLHLFVWDKQNHCIVGGYRLGLVDEIMAGYGRRGLYSYSLFRYSHSFLHQIAPAIELGRSFVRPEYQRSFAPLMLLWKGIGRFVARHPQYANLFGPVSISNDYTSMSQLLLIRFLKQNLFDGSLGRHVRARNPYRLRQRLELFASGQKMNLEELSALIADIEEDDKGVPVLIRQYLKMGGKMLGFNVDPAFGDCIDGLIRVDLRHADPKVLSKYLGTDGAQAFIDWHKREQQQAG